MNYLYYLYPVGRKVSFSFISQQHIRYLKVILKGKLRIIEADVEIFDPTSWGIKRKLLIHPLFYPFFEGVTKDALTKVDKLVQCLNKGFKVIAFDTADSNRISDRAVELANLVEAVIVPSNFARNTFITSGVLTPVYVVPHGIPEEFMTEKRDITHPDLLRLKELKEKNNLLFVQFNITHSGYRKGADLFAKAMYIVQKENPNIVILAKRLDILDPYLAYFRRLRSVEVASYLDMDSFRQLYDLTDIMVLTSRGGGFEHNGLEALARGVPTIVPRAGCFLDYAQYAIPVDVTNNYPVVLPNNPIHVGRGWEVDVNKLAETILKVADNLEHYRKKAQSNMKEIWEKYSWKRVAEMIYEILEKHDFLNGKSNERTKAF